MRVKDVALRGLLLGFGGGRKDGGRGGRGSLIHRLKDSVHNHRFLYFACLILTVNLAALGLVRHELLSARTGRLRVLAALPSGFADKADRLALELDDVLGRSDQLGKPLDKSPFAITPAVAGHWQWGAPQRLEFLPDRPLPLGRLFSVQAAADIEVQTGRRLVGDAKFEFRTSPLAVQTCQLAGTDREHITIELTFNQPVHPADLLRHFLVRDAGNVPLAASCLTKDPAPKLTVQATSPAFHPGNGAETVRVLLREGLAGHGAQLGLVSNQEYPLAVQPHFCLLNNTVNAPGLDKELSAFLNFSSPIDSKSSLPAISVSPEVKGLQISRNGQQLSLTGEFQPSSSYKVTVPATLLSANGETLGQPATTTLAFAGRESCVSLEGFPDGSRGVLSPNGKLSIDVQAVNITALSVTASRVYANNLIAHLGPRHRHSDGASWTSRELPAKEFKLDMPRDQVKSMVLDLRDVIGQKPLGIYHIRAVAREDRWADDWALVCVTDLGMTVKSYDGGALVWVTSLATAKPVAGATVSGLTKTNQTVAVATTDANGLATLPSRPDNPDGPMWVVTAQLGEDLSYVKSDDQQWVIEEVDQGGKAAPETYEAFIYAERGIYRPGETIHLTGIIRDAAGKVPPQMPLWVRVRRPDNREMAAINVASEAGQGVFQADYPLCEQCWSGTWGFEVTLPGSDKSLGETMAAVEAFVPIRIEVKAAPTKDLYFSKDTPTVDVTARYLFGPPAAGLATSVDGLYTRIAYQSARYKEYAFDGGADQNKQDSILIPPHELDGQGHASLKLPSPFTPLPAPAPTTAPTAATAAAVSAPAVAVANVPEARIPPPPAAAPRAPVPVEGTPAPPTMPPVDRKGLWQARVGVTVTEDGGRSVSANASYRIDTAGSHVGVSMPRDNIVRAGSLPKTLEIPYVVVDGEDRLAAGGTPIDVSLSRLQWDWCVEQVNGHPTWKSTQQVIPVKAFRLDGKDAPAQGKLAIVCPEPGQYKLRIVDVSSGMATEAQFYAVGIGTSSGEGDGANLVQRPERVEVVLGRERIAPGDTDDVLVRSPFAGTLLVTLESNRVLWSKVIEMTGKSASLQVTVPPDVVGGAFVSATVVRAVDSGQDKWLPHRAMGMARLATDHQRNKLPLAVTAGDKCRPGEKVRVAIKSSPASDPQRPAVVHLWAVDDGILLTTRFKAPDPIAHFFAPRALAVESCDLFDQLLPDYKRPVSMTRIGAGGGERSSKDEDEARAMRITPVPLKHRPSAVVWQKFVALGPDGTANIDLQMPDITGRLRLMAVAVDQDRYATAERPVTLDAPLMIEPSLPRFAAPGDEFVVPVKVFNNTPDKLAVFLSAKCEGNMTAKGPGDTDYGFPEDDRRDYSPCEEPQQLHIPPLSSLTVGYTVTAGEVGDAKITFSVHAPNTEYKATEACELSIAAVTPLHYVVRNLRVEAGKEITIDPPKELQPGTAKVTLAISGRPDIDLRPAIEQLIDYPYGCVEQTTSRMYPMLYAPQILADDSRSQGVKQMVQAGIYRLWSMQTTDGGLAYWPGGSQSTPWGTAYAALCLANARQGGYEIDKKFIDDLSKYLNSQLNAEPDGQGHGEPNTKAMICHVLSLLGQPANGWMSFLAERLDQFDLGGRAHLAAAYMAAGRRDLAAKCLPEDSINHVGALATSGRITSGIAQRAQLLSVMLDLNKSHAAIPGLAMQLNQARTGVGYWGTTLDNAACITALCRYQLATVAPPDFTGTAALPDGKTVNFSSSLSLTAEGKHDAVSVAKFTGFGKPIAITSQGKGDVYISLEAQGLLAGGSYETYDRQLEVRRTWKDPRGLPLDLAKLHVGDLVKVEITCRTTSGACVDNIAIVDGLPACAEIENPAIATSTFAVGSQATPSGVQMLDDRAVLFVSAGPQKLQGTHIYSYMVRIISAGRFHQPPIQASCMYDTGYASVNGGLFGKNVLTVEDTVRPAPTTRSAPAAQPAEPEQPAHRARHAGKHAPAAAPPAGGQDASQMDADDDSPSDDEQADDDCDE